MSEFDGRRDARNINEPWWQRAEAQAHQIENDYNAIDALVDVPNPEASSWELFTFWERKRFNLTSWRKRS